jgi:hypothetical protein
MATNPPTPTVLTKQNSARQDVVDYSPYEKFVARLLLAYLVAAFVFGLWVMTDAFHGASTLIALFRPVPSTQATKPLDVSSSQAPSPIAGTEAADTLVVLAAGAGLFGATISALRSLCEHYAATVENASELAKQEAERFHTQWSIRWFAGPLMGAGLALIVFALVRSGVLVFANGAASPEQNLTVTSEFASIGLGGLVGLGSKDVIEKLILVLKSALKVEEPEDKVLRVLPQNALLKFGGQAIRFAVKPEMPVTWTVEPTNLGSLTNGVFRTLDTAPGGISGSPAVVVTATSKSDSSQSASAILIVDSSP